MLKSSQNYFLKMAYNNRIENIVSSEIVSPSLWKWTLSPFGFQHQKCNLQNNGWSPISNQKNVICQIKFSAANLLLAVFHCSLKIKIFQVKPLLLSFDSMACQSIILILSTENINFLHHLPYPSIFPVVCGTAPPPPKKKTKWKRKNNNKMKLKSEET